jgi:hypothetical protein
MEDTRHGQAGPRQQCAGYGAPGLGRRAAVIGRAANAMRPALQEGQCALLQPRHRVRRRHSPWPTHRHPKSGRVCHPPPPPRGAHGRCETDRPPRWRDRGPATAAAVGLMRIDRHGGLCGQPVRVPLVEPAPRLGCLPALDDIDQPAPAGGDQPGGPQGWGARRWRPATPSPRPPRPPTGRPRPPVGTSPAGPVGEHRPRRGLLGVLAPGLDRTVRIRAHPSAFAPHQHHRPTPRR